jgi:hypothetical protein
VIAVTAKIERLAKLLHAQLVANEEAEIARGYLDDEPYFRTEPYPPATEAAIAAAEKKLVFAFPPSYRAFLALHNGWRKFNGGDITVLGVSGPGYDKLPPAIKGQRREKRTPKQVFDDEVALQEKAWKRPREKAEAEALREQDANGEAIYFPRHPPVAVNYNAGVVVFDRHRRAKSGEYPVVPIKFGLAEDHEWPTFTAYLEHWIAVTGKR